MSQDMFTVTLPKSASEQEVMRFLKEICVKATNLARFGYDVKSAYTQPYYHAGRFIAAQQSQGSGLERLGTIAEVLVDPKSAMQEFIQEKTEGSLKRAFDQVVQMKDKPTQGESTVQGRMAVSSTATATTGVGAGFTGGNTQPQQSTVGNAGGAGSKVIPSNPTPSTTSEPATTTTAPATASESYVPIQSLVGMSAYDSEAMLLGKVAEIGLKKAGANAQITIKVGDKEIPWDGISKIGDIVLLKSANEARQTPAAGGKCRACGFENEADSAFCAECGATLS